MPKISQHLVITGIFTSALVCLVLLLQQISIRCLENTRAGAYRNSCSTVRSGLWWTKSCTILINLKHKSQLCSISATKLFTFF